MLALLTTGEAWSPPPTEVNPRAGQQEQCQSKQTPLGNGRDPSARHDRLEDARVVNAKIARAYIGVLALTVRAATTGDRTVGTGVTNTVVDRTLVAIITFRCIDAAAWELAA